VKLLDRFYKMTSMGYANHSARVLRDREKAKANREFILGYLRERTEVFDVLQSVGSDPFKLRDFEEFAAMSRLQAQEVVTVLKGHKMIRVMSKGYMRAEPGMIQIVKKLEEEWDA
jgi:L-lysine 2,3-aminomutase